MLLYEFDFNNSQNVEFYEESNKTGIKEVKQKFEGKILTTGKHKIIRIKLITEWKIKANFKFTIKNLPRDIQARITESDRNELKNNFLIFQKVFGHLGLDHMPVD